MQDSTLGIIGLTTSTIAVLYLFFTLILVPILPDQSIMNYKFDLDHQENLLFTLALSGLLFIGTLSIITMCKLFKIN